jgi:acyl-coenzyme A thioesterase PaaI-like protein
MAELSLEQALDRLPYAQCLGVKPLMMGEELTLILPYKEDNIGNPMLPALHGGCIGGFMELAAMAQLILTAPNQSFPKPIGMNVNYLRRGNPVDTYARAFITKRGSRVANVRVRAWQDNYDAPIASLDGHFMTAASDG